MNRGLLNRFSALRKKTEQICHPLAIEDYSVQPSLDVSPPKWHLAHTTWFWEQFVLVPFSVDYPIFHPDFAYLFNSYYNNAGKRVLRPNRGLMTRPTVQEVLNYRAYVTEAMEELLSKNLEDTLLDLIEIGINHEEQHQELLAYDIKFILGHQPTFPSFENNFRLHAQTSGQDEWVNVPEGLYSIGHQGEGFCFDNELGAHKVYVQAFEIAKNVVTNGEFIEFIQDGGYRDFNLWHAEGWDYVNTHQLQAPMYWYEIDGVWHAYHYDGLQKVDATLPVTHISLYEAYAFAEWKKMRLPTEFEWEIAADQINWGQVWEWTNSAYLPYPKFSKAPGALGEYNGKFMVNMHVLRGASIATPHNHSRKTYRNFFHPHLRWMFSGIRLAK